MPAEGTMRINTTRFGKVEVKDTDLLDFPFGLIGLEICHQWVVLADSNHNGLGWLQSVDRPDVAFAIVSPRRFVSDYRARVSARDLEPLGLPAGTQPQVVVTVSQNISSRGEKRLTLNLKAPVVVCLETKVGRQIVAKDDHPVRHWLEPSNSLRRSA